MLGQPSLDEQAVIADTLQRPASSMTTRERLGEALATGGFAVTVAALWLRSPPHGFTPWPALVCLLVLVLALRIRIDTPFGFTVPTQLAFVPLLFSMPFAVVPIAVVIASALARLPDVLSGDVRPSRLVQTVGNAWWSVGPVVVFAIAQTPPAKAGPALLVAALGAQFVVDFAVSAARFAIARGATIVAQLARDLGVRRRRRPFGRRAAGRRADPALAGRGARAAAAAGARRAVRA